MNLLLNEKRRCPNDEVGPILHILSTPDELRVEVAVTPLVRDLNRVLIFFGKQRLILGGRNVLSRRLTVGEILNCFDSSGASRRSCHVFLRAVLLFKRSYLIGSTPRSRQIFLAKRSWISWCRGTAVRRSLRSLRHHEFRPPPRTRRQPFRCRYRKSSVRFMQGRLFPRYNRGQPLPRLPGD